MRNLSQKKAFTLIEILVVIAIIALLAAILFPVFSRARERARATSCMSNQKQIALSLIQYTQDHGRRFPPAHAAGADGWAISIGLTDSINGAVFRCPSQRQDDVPDAFSDYFFNSELMWSVPVPVSVDPPPARTASLSEVRVRYPANTIMIGDGPAGSSHSNLGAAADTNLDPSNSPIVAWSPNGSPNDPTGYAKRHSGGANYAFADGHVKWLNPDSINTTDAAAGDNFAFYVKAP